MIKGNKKVTYKDINTKQKTHTNLIQTRAHNHPNFNSQSSLPCFVGGGEGVWYSAK